MANIYLEIGDTQVSLADVNASVEKAAGKAKDLKIFYKVEERKAYYVADDKADGEFVEF